MWDGVGALNVGQHTGLAVGEWHIHAWDLLEVAVYGHDPYRREGELELTCRLAELRRSAMQRSDAIVLGTKRVGFFGGERELVVRRRLDRAQTEMSHAPVQQHRSAFKSIAPSIPRSSPPDARHCRNRCRWAIRGRRRCAGPAESPGRVSKLRPTSPTTTPCWREPGRSRRPRVAEIDSKRKLPADVRELLDLAEKAIRARAGGEP